MCREFAYAEFCCFDAAILDPDALEVLREITVEIEATRSRAERFGLRRKRIGEFLDYLVRCEERWVVEAKRRELGPEWQHQLVQSDLRPAIMKDTEAAYASARRLYDIPARGRVDIADAATKVVDPTTYTGTIVNAWPDKDYVFIRGEDDTDWFSHRRDFVTDADWHNRDRDVDCVFLRGDWNGKPRATSVRIRR
jgi:hypothetical protein